MSDVAEKPTRPSSITLVSVYVFLIGLLSFYYLIAVDIQKIGVLKYTFFVFSGIVFLVCGIGFWLMKKWAVYLYTVFSVIYQIILFMTGRLNITILLVVIVIYLGIKNISKMS